MNPHSLYDLAVHSVNHNVNFYDNIKSLDTKLPSSVIRSLENNYYFSKMYNTDSKDTRLKKNLPQKLKSLRDDKQYGVVYEGVFVSESPKGLCSHSNSNFWTVGSSYCKPCWCGNVEKKVPKSGRVRSNIFDGTYKCAYYGFEIKQNPSKHVCKVCDKVLITADRQKPRSCCWSCAI